MPKFHLLATKKGVKFVCLSNENPQLLADLQKALEKKTPDIVYEVVPSLDFSRILLREVK
jgi:hypothetical protein